MKVLQLVDSLAVGGTERMAVNISNVLSKEGIPNRLVVARKGGGLQSQVESRENLVFLGKKNFYDLAAFRALTQLISDFKPTIIHAHSSSVFWAVMGKIFTRQDCLIIFHDHFGKSEFLKKGDRKPLIFVSKWINGVIAVNDQLKIWNEENLSVMRESIIQMNNFPYLSLKPGTNPKRDELKILFLANFRPQKDHLTFLKAFKLVRESHPEIPLKMYLVGLFTEDEYFGKVSKEIARLNLSEDVLHVGPSDQVEDFLNDSDIGVLSSTSEGLPVSLLEYGLAGLQVVATKVGQISQVLGDGKYGDLVEPSDPEKFAKGLERALERALKGRNNPLKIHVQENFGGSLFMQSYQAFIQRLT